MQTLQGSKQMTEKVFNLSLTVWKMFVYAPVNILEKFLQEVMNSASSYQLGNIETIILFY